MGYGTGISLYRLIIEDSYFELEKEKDMFLRPQRIQWFNRGMHHLDLQVINGKFYAFYDGDKRAKGAKKFQYRRTFKLAFYDLLNFNKLNEIYSNHLYPS